MASLNLAGKTSGYVKVTAPDDSSTNPTVVLPTESGELALKSDITGGGGGDSLWTESGGDTATYSSTGNSTIVSKSNSGQYSTYQVDNADQKYSMQIRPDVSNAFVIRNETSGQNSMSIATDGKVTTQQDMTVNGVNVGLGKNGLDTNTSVGLNALNSVTTGSKNTAVGRQALEENTEGGSNVAVGYGALVKSTGDQNIGIGRGSGSQLTTGSNNILIGHGVQPSAPDVSNEVTIGDENVTTVRMGNGDVIYPSSGGEAQPPVVMKALVNSKQTLTHGSGVTLSFGDVKFDEDNTYDPSTKRWTPNVEGHYLVQSGFTTKQLFPAGIRYVKVSLRKNDDVIAHGSLDFQSNTDLGETQSSEVSSIIYMNGTTDYIEVRGSCEIVGDPREVDLEEGNYSYFQSHLITGQSSGGSGEATGTPTIHEVEKLVDVPTLDGTDWITWSEKGITLNVKSGQTYTLNLSGQYSGRTNDAPISEFKFVKDKGGVLEDIGETAYVGSIVTGVKSALFTSIAHQYTFTATSDETVLFSAYMRAQSGSQTLTNGEFTVTSFGTGGASSGGGDYTPEKMVWENVTADREDNVEYTNDYDAPLLVRVYANANGGGQSLLPYIDNEPFGRTGSSGTDEPYVTIEFTVPSGSTYKVEAIDNMPIVWWKEAKMPVAVGTGGKTVAFRGHLGADQSVTTETWTKVELDNASVDTDKSLTDSKFQPNVAGYYQVSGGVRQFCNPTSSVTISSLYLNGSKKTTGTNVSSDTSSDSSQVSDIVYLNGTTDYIELYGYVNSSGTCKIISDWTSTYLSAVLVSGGSASGGGSGGGTPATYVTFDGTTAEPTIKGSNNVSSVVKNSVGDYTINFATPMSDSDYAVSLSNVTTSASINTVHAKIKGTTTGGADLKTPTQLTIKTAGSSSSVDMSLVSVAIIDKNSSSGGGDSIWTEEDGKAVYDGNVGIGGTPADFNGTNLHVKSDDVASVLAEANGRVTQILANEAAGCVVGARSNHGLQIITNDQTRMTISREGSLFAPAVWNDTASVGETPNVCVGNDGKLFRSLTTTYSAEEVDKKLAIKDKLIEKLSDRLDKLEKKLKKTK